MESKVAFLKKKGLSDAEIDLAVKQSQVIIQSRSFEHSKNQTTVLQPYMTPWPVQSRWSKYRDVVDTIAIIGALSYAVYWFYKKYLAPFLFGSKKSLDTRISDLDQLITTSVSDIKLDVVKIKEEVMKASEKKIDSLNRQLEELKNELASLKKILLNRKQFPSTTVATPLSIPAWQMASSEEKEVEEEGVGSGTNGSDSSLEMIKE
ncbi:peroxisomal membrane protein PEX14 isoform X2 [Cimex lectularius]|nr:peroxisomal membrane protein PEX14 isoform X2 [Cimex lectularius]